MHHAAEGSLQAYLDGELETMEVSALERHVDVCPACASELAALRGAAARFTAAVGVLDTAPAAPRRAAMPLSLRTRRVWYGPRRVLARAATVIVALGLSAALLEATTGVVSDLVGRVGSVLAGPEQPELAEPLPATPTEASAEQASMWFEPSGGIARVSVDDAGPGVTLRVRLHDEPDVLVVVHGTSDPEWRRSAGAASISAGEADVVEIALPRDLDVARVDVNGVRYLTKEGANLHWPVTPADTSDAVLEWTLPRR